MKSRFLLVFLILSPSAFGALNLSQERGQKSVAHSMDEVCIIPKAIPGLEGILPTKKEERLCELDFHADPKTAICPKEFSTNPAVEVYEITTDLSKIEFESKQCLSKHKDEFAKKRAKFKQSITCSYTPSILGYYQLSKWFGGALHIPPSVLRTMDAAEHRKVVQIGKKTAIANMWASFDKTVAAPASYPNLYTGDGKFLYGALSINPSGEEFYSEFFGPKHTYEKGLWAFQQTKVYQNLTKEGPVSKYVSQRFEEAAQSIQAMKDASLLILFDTLMNQQDRFGNVHYRAYYQYPDGQRVEHADVKELSEEDAKARGAVLVKELFMKDNDCGVKKSNLMKAAHVIEEVRHMDPTDYSQFARLAHAVARDELKEYFASELLFTDADYLSVKKNFSDTFKVLKANCESGRLIQDLSIDEHVGLVPSATHPCDVE